MIISAEKRPVRLNKFLALCGLGSRRKVEDFILTGRVKINNRIVKNLAQTVLIDQDVVEFDNLKLKPPDNFAYLMLNKPKGYITTLKDEKDRPIVMNLLPERYKKLGLNPVGRLDKDTEGLLLFTNDGDLAQHLMKPRFKIAKEYLLELDKPLSSIDQKRLEKGIYLHQLKLKTRPAIIKNLNETKTLIKMTIYEGKKRQIRYSFFNLNYKIKKLKRVTFGPLQLTGVNRGSYRSLKPNEIRALKKIT